MMSSDLVARLAGIEARAKERGPVELPAMPHEHTKAVQLPLWPEPVRGVPNSILRSALFGAIKRGKRAYQDGVRKASVEGVTVIHTGPQLDQADLDVWEQCMHLARTGGLGVEIRFTAHGFLKAIDRGTGKSQHEWLKKALRRLMTSLVELEDGQRAYAGQLLHNWARDEETGQHVIEINPKIAAMYNADGWTAVEVEQRRALKRQPLAQWLHSFYSTHAAPFAYKVETLHRLCGSESKRLDHFRDELRKSLEKLEEATGWTWDVDGDDLVHISKTGSASQGRHLLRKTVQRIKGTA